MSSDTPIQKDKNVLLIDPERLVIVKKDTDPLFDERGKWPVNEAMVKSIMVYGVIESITVRVNGEKNGEPIFEVIDGRQRTINCREANKRLEKEGSQTHRIACRVRNDEEKVLMGIMVTANEVRRGDALMTKAHKAQRLLAAGQTEAEAAVAFGCSVATIKNLLLLLECDKTVQTAVANGELSADIAKKMAKMTKEEQRNALESLRKEKATKGKSARKALEKATGKVIDDGFLGKKGIQQLYEDLKMTAKATKDSEEPGLLEGIKLVEHILGKRARCPFSFVEVQVDTDDGKVEEEPKKRKPKSETRVSATPGQAAARKKKEAETVTLGDSEAPPA